MTEVYIKAASFLLMVFMGHMARRMGLMGPEARQVLAKITVNITLPAAIIINFASAVVDPALLFILVVALAQNLLLVGVGWLTGRGKPREVHAAYMVNSGGQNIGSFALPYVQSFLPPLGTVTACVYDVGNAFVCAGGAYAITSAVLYPGSEGFRFSALLKKIFTTPAVVVYTVMFLLGVVNVRPGPLLVELLRPVANANVFCSMFMLGLMFHIEIKWDYLSRILQILGPRLLCAAVFAVASWTLLPFPMEVRQAMVLMPFSPITSLAPVYTQKLGADEGLASCTNSISILLSLVLLNVLLVVLGL